MVTDPSTDPRTMQSAWGLDTRHQLAKRMCEFFAPENREKGFAAVGRELSDPARAEGLTLIDFASCYPGTPGTGEPLNVFRLSELMERMVSVGLLTRLIGRPGIWGIPESQYLYFGPTDDRGDTMNLVLALGPDFLYRVCEPGLVHIAGKKEGVVDAGTGIVVDDRHVLTCHHVVSDMKVDPEQTFQDHEYEITDELIHRHPKIDMAVIRVNGPPLAPLPDLVLRPPIVAQPVFALGYPKLPGLQRAYVIMQPGAVTNESVISLAGDSLFLYSAIARPGNSGGPVMSEDGYLVGMSIADATAEYCNKDAFSPHYAGIPSQVLFHAVDDLELGIQLRFQACE